MNVERIQIAAYQRTQKKADHIEASAKGTFQALAVSNDSSKRDPSRDQRPQTPPEELPIDELPNEEPEVQEAEAHVDVIA